WTHGANRGRVRRGLASKRPDSSGRSSACIGSIGLSVSYSSCSSGMRRGGDLDSNSWVAARPYCNGRATGFNKVLTRSQSVVCAGEQKSASRRKASQVGFHRPGCGTISKLQIPSSKLQRNIKHQTSKQHIARFVGVWLLELLWCLELGVW